MKTQDKFVVGKEFSYIGQNFQDWFYDMNLEIKDTPLFSKKLERDMLDREILEELKPSELTLGEVYNYLTIKGSKDDWMIFYCRDKDGELRAVFVGWGGGGWDLSAYSLEDPHGWNEGRRVSSRNSFDTLALDSSESMFNKNAGGNGYTEMIKKHNDDGTYYFVYKDHYETTI